MIDTRLVVCSFLRYAFKDSFCSLFIKAYACSLIQPEDSDFKILAHMLSLITGDQEIKYDVVLESSYEWLFGELLLGSPNGV